MISTTNVSTYREFEEWQQDFSGGRINFLVIVGPRGTAKSTLFREAFTGIDHLYHRGIVSARGFYEMLFSHADQPVILDDVTSLLGNKDCVDLTLSLCDTEAEKTVRYGKKNLGEVLVKRPDGTTHCAPLPPIFTTRSKTCLITNKITKSIPFPVREAILDRATIVSFTPSAEEIHRYASYHGVFHTEIYNWIGQHLDLIPQHSLRYYEKAIELEHRDWRQWLLDAWSGNPRQSKFLRILRDASIPSIGEKASAFRIAGLGNEKTFFNWRKKHEAGVLFEEEEVFA